MKKAPKDANSLEMVVRLPHDNFDVGNHWILTNGETVSIRAQKVGESPTESIDIPRNVFNKMVRWWTRPVTVRKR